MKREQAAPMALPAFLFFFGMASKVRPKGRRQRRRPLGCHSTRAPRRMGRIPKRACGRCGRRFSKRAFGAGRGAGCRRGRAAAGVFEVDAGRSHDGTGKGVCGGFVEYRPRQSLRILGRRGVSGHGSAGFRYYSDAGCRK